MEILSELLKELEEKNLDSIKIEEKIASLKKENDQIESQNPEIKKEFGYILTISQKKPCEVIEIQIFGPFYYIQHKDLIKDQSQEIIISLNSQNSNLSLEKIINQIKNGEL